jgi:hypothetical protein
MISIKMRSERKRHMRLRPGRSHGQSQQPEEVERQDESIPVASHLCRRLVHLVALLYTLPSALSAAKHTTSTAQRIPSLSAFLNFSAKFFKFSCIQSVMDFLAKFGTWTCRNSLHSRLTKWFPRFWDLAHLATDTHQEHWGAHLRKHVLDRAECHDLPIELRTTLLQYG